LNIAAKNMAWPAALMLGLLVLISNSAWADIYRYVDKNGVWHFTNIKTDTRYRLYISTTRKAPSD